MTFSNDQPLVSNQLEISIDFPSPEKKEFLDLLSITYKKVADTVNKKEGSLYSLQEIANFKQYFTVNNPQTFRNAYRKTFDVRELNGADIAPAATVSFPHGITGLLYSAIIYASCKNQAGELFSVMYPDATLDAVNLNFTNPSASAVTQCYFVAEYLKN